MAKFTTKSLIKAVGGEEKISQVVIDSGTNFLSGKITSAFNAIQSDKTNLYILKVINTEINSDKPILNKTFSDLDALQKYIDNDKAKRKGSYAKDDFDKVFKYNVENKSVGTAGTITNAAAQLVGVYGTVDTLLNNEQIINDMVTDLVTEVTSTVVDEATKLISDGIQKIITATLTIPTMTAQIAMKTFNEEKLTMADIMEMIDTEAEKRFEKKKEEMEESLEEGRSRKTSETINKIKGYITKVSFEIGEVVNKVGPYLQEGPEIAADYINQAIDDKVTFVKEIVDQEVDKHISYITQWCKDRGRDAGIALADKFNKIIEKKSKKIINQLAEQKAKLKLKVFAATQKAQLKIMSITGVNIPMPVNTLA